MNERPLGSVSPCEIGLVNTSFFILGVTEFILLEFFEFRSGFVIDNVTLVNVSASKPGAEVKLD